MVKTVTEFFRLGNSTYGDWTKCADTWLEQGAPTQNNGADAGIEITDLIFGAGTLFRALFSFEIPPSATLGDTPVAELYLDFRKLSTGSGAAKFMRVSDVTKDFVEGTETGGTLGTGATWNTYDGVHTWGTAGGADNTQVYTLIKPDGTSAQWLSEIVGYPGGIDLTALIQALGLGVGDTVSIILAWADEATATQDVLLYSRSGTVQATTWPAGAPGTWGVTASDYFRPVLKVLYVDEPPTQVSDLTITPNPKNPSTLVLEWSANEDSDFEKYDLYYSATAGGARYGGSGGALVYQIGRGAAQIPSAGVVKAETVLGQAGNPGENDLTYYSMGVEDASNTNADATWGPEVQVIRPDVLGAGSRTNGAGAQVATASPSIHRVSALDNFNTISCGDKVCIAVTGKGDNLTEGAMVFEPQSFIVDWGDGTPVTTYPVKATTFSANEAAQQTILSVTDPTIFIIGKCYVAYNGTNFDVFRVTAITSTTITVSTDLTITGRTTNSIYYGYSTGDPIIGPLPEHVYTGSGAIVAYAKLVNSAGFASNATSSANTSFSVATLAPVAVIDASIRNPLTTDTVRYTANRAYHRDSARPITSYRWSIDNAGSGGDPDVADATTTVPYTTHNHGSAGTCRVALQVYDGTTASSTANDWGDASNPQADVSLTVAAESVLAIPSGLTDGFNQAYTYRKGRKIAKVDGIDLRERVIMGDGKALVYLQIGGTAYSTPTSNIPVDITTLEDACTNKKGITLSLPRSTSGVATLSGYIEDLTYHMTGVNSFDWTADLVMDAPT